VAAIAGSCAGTPPAAAAEVGFHEVRNFGDNPGNLKMFAYVPAGARSGAPVVVLFHGCGGSAAGLAQTTGWRKYADAYGFTIVFPEQKPTYHLQSMGHQAPIDPGTGIDKCGTAGQGCSSMCGPYYATRFFGLGAAAAP
jgi:poly(3-hydroxybutyrate) depolymerase